MSIFLKLKLLFRIFRMMKVYKHFKGEYYVKIATGSHHENPKDRFVIYASTNSKVWVREYDNFHGYKTSDKGEYFFYKGRITTYAKRFEEVQ